MKAKSLKILTGVIVTCLVFIQSLSSACAVILYQGKNQFGPVWVHDVGGNRTLTFLADSSIFQSIMKMDQPDIIQAEYIKMLFSSLYYNKAPQNILLLGLGGGTFARAINTILPFSKLDIVEINPLVLELAKRYFLFEPNNNTVINVADGYNYIMNAESSKYDFVVLDAFDREYIPAPFLTEEFVKNVKRVLKSDGVVAVNTFQNTKFSETESKLYNQVFGKFYEITNGSSKIMISRKSNLPPKNQIKSNAEGWNFPFYRIGIDTKWLVEKYNQPK